MDPNTEVANRLANIVELYACGNYCPKHNEYDDSDQWAAEQVRELAKTDPTLDEKSPLYDALKCHLKKHDLVQERAAVELGGLAAYAASLNVPFSLEMAIAMLEPMAKKTYWRSSHGTCW